MKRNVPVTEIMTNHPLTVHIGDKLSDVRQAMETGGFHHVPVVSGKKLIGMITATDLLRVMTELGDPRATDALLDHSFTLGETMTSGLTTVSRHDTIRDAAQVLAEGRFHSLPVVDDGELVGIVTATDLIRYLLEQY